MPAPVLVDAHLGELPGIADAVPDEIVAAVAGPQVVVEPGNRIADDLLALGEEEREVGKDAGARRRRQVRLVGGAAPDVVARVDRLHLRGNLVAHAGPDAVAADQQIGALGLSVGKADAHLAAVLLDPLEGAAEMIAPGRDRLAQQALEPVP